MPNLELSHLPSPASRLTAFWKSFNNNESMWSTTMWCLLTKKAYYLLRNVRLLCLQVCIPVCLVLAASRLHDTHTDTPKALNLNTELLKGSTATFQRESENNFTILLAAAYRKLLRDPAGKRDITVKSQMPEYTPLTRNPLATSTDTSGLDFLLIGAKVLNKEDTKWTKVYVSALFNAQVYHAEPLSIVAMMRALAEVDSNGKSAIINKTTVQWSLQPLPLTLQEEAIRAKEATDRSCLISSSLVLTALNFLASIFAYLVATEKAVGSLQLQKLCGVSGTWFYITTMLFDFIVYASVCTLLYVCILHFRYPTMYSDGGTMLFILTSSGLPAIPIVYLFPMSIYSKPAMCVFLHFVMRLSIDAVILTVWKEFTFDALLPFDYKNFIVRGLYPPFNLFKVIYTDCHLASTSRRATPLEPTTSFLNSLIKHRMIDYIVFNTAQFTLWFSCCIIIDDSSWDNFKKTLKKYFCRWTRGIKSEMASKQFLDQDKLGLKGFLEIIGRKKPVGVFLEEYEGECFGLLGPVLCGKTSVVKMITGCYVTSDSKKTHVPSRVGYNMGYCSENCAAMNEMTGRETLSLYGKLRGLPSGDLKAKVNDVIDLLDLSRVANVTCAHYSDTDKQKLNIGMALIGDPKVVVLDEPLLHLDVTVAKKLKDKLNSMRRNRQVIFLATTCAQECEHLCSWIYFMSNGKIISQSKMSDVLHKYCNGFVARLKFKTDDNGNQIEDDSCFTRVADLFHDVEILTDSLYSHVFFHKDDLNLSKAFAFLEDSKTYHGVMEYTLQKTSLKHCLYYLTANPPGKPIVVVPMFVTAASVHRSPSIVASFELE